MSETDCFVCSAPIEDGDWVIPLETYEAKYRDDELVFNADKTLETVVHADCLKNTTS